MTSLLLTLSFEQLIDQLRWGILWQGTLETLQMTFISLGLTLIIGLPLGFILFLTSPGQLMAQGLIYRILSFIVNVMRSVPFIILLIVLIPFTRWITGTSLGVAGAIPSLVAAAVPFFARLIENVLKELNTGILEACKAMGANTWQTVGLALLPEATTGILAAIVVTGINLVGYTAMAGAVGAGGLGDIAIQYGYNRFQPGMLLATVPLLVIIVQGMQSLGDGLIKRLRRTP